MIDPILQHTIMPLSPRADSIPPFLTIDRQRRAATPKLPS